MITWDNFYLFALPAIVLWGAGAVFALFSKGRSRWAIGLTLSGIPIKNEYHNLVSPMVRKGGR